MAVRKHKLEYKERFDFLLLGLVSAENDYRLIWQINQFLDYGFEKTVNHKILAKGIQAEQEFSQFVYEHDGLCLFFRLLSNKSIHGVLIEELKNIDYLLMVQGEMNESFIMSFIAGLKKVENIQAVFRIDPLTLKSRDKLLA